MRGAVIAGRDLYKQEERLFIKGNKGKWEKKLEKASIKKMSALFLM